WAPLLADYDNDGWKDVFVANGYFRDYTNRDFLKYKGDYYFEKGKAREKADTFHLVTSMTSTPIRNYLFRNQGNLTFEDVSERWGITEKNFSSGAAYADLDNDGDLDLLTNNQNAPATVMRNKAREQFPEHHYLQIRLSGKGRNTHAIGTTLAVFAGGHQQFFEYMPTRGFQSSVAPRVHVGLGNVSAVDSVVVVWPSGVRQAFQNVAVDQLLVLEEPETSTTPRSHPPDAQLNPVFSPTDPLVPYAHIEQGYNDFKRQPLLTTMLTTCGPILASGDVNGDGRTDVFAGGTQGNPGKLFVQMPDG